MFGFPAYKKNNLPRLSVSDKCQDLNSQSGMSLIAVMIAVGILGIAAYVLAEVFKNQFIAQKKLDLKVARLAVVRNLNARITDYCPPRTDPTLPDPLRIVVPATCPDPTYLEIPGAPGQAVIVSRFDPANPLGAQRMGGLALRAKCCVGRPECPGAGKTLKVEAVDALKLERAPEEAAREWFDVSPSIPLSCNINR